jgi:uncharacterized protein YktA (UPF0223 family)
MISENKTESEIIRELVATGKRTQVLRNLGRDVTTKAVRHAQKEVMRETLAPLIDKLEKQDVYLRERDVHLGNEYASIEEKIQTLTEGFARILQNIVVIRALLWNYVFVFFNQLMRAKGKEITTEQLNAMYNKEVVRAHIEAAEKRVVIDEREMEQATTRFGKYLTEETAHPTVSPETERRPL